MPMRIKIMTQRRSSRSSKVVLAAALCLAATLGCGAGQTAQRPPQAAGTPAAWNLVWSDEFNGPANSVPDASVWKYDLGGGGWGNGELEHYCAPFSSAAPCVAGRSNIYEDGNGHLVIQATRASDGTWTSGRLKTEGTKSFQYGRIEARMKLPVAAGFWPAFWMLGANIGTVGWPAAGEQDIMEWVQSYGPTTTSSTLHGPGYSGAHGIGNRFTFPAGGQVDTDFHTYGVIWAKDKLQFYRDDPAKIYFTLTPTNLPAGTTWVYNQPFFILLNFAIGSHGFAGGTDASTPASGKVLVDYVRVYQSSSAKP